jgi:hypothetical protein
VLDRLDLQPSADRGQDLMTLLLCFTVLLVSACTYCKGGYVQVVGISTSTVHSTEEITQTSPRTRTR